MTTTAPERTDKLQDTLEANARYLRAELAAGRWTGLRFIRFRPEREIADTLRIAETKARAAVLAAAEEAEENLTDERVEERVARDPLVDFLRDALRVHAPANQTAGCPVGYDQPPYPLDEQDRDRLYEDTARILREQLPRIMPGNDEGWSWRVEPQVSTDSSALLLRLTPRNVRFEDPIVHAQTPEQQAGPEETPATVPPAGDGRTAPVTPATPAPAPEGDKKPPENPPT